jgi:tRNA-splicing ligase RtcB
MQVNTEGNIPVKLWLDDIEDNAMEQVKHLSILPFAYHHIAIMSDAHQGYGMPIGGVLATTDVVIPNAVGVDIGCGMCAVKTSLTELPVERLKEIMGKIRQTIPVGFAHHKDRQDMKLMPELDREKNYITDAFNHGSGIVSREYDKALYQIGTLGGGNHFIEIQKGSDGHIWIMIHSGSRNFGLQIADYYNKKAVELNEKWHSKIPEEWELAFLPIDSDEGQAYIKEMQYCVEFALANRKLMMERIADIFDKNTSAPFIDMNEMINIAHNYASLEHHFGKDVWVHRKGATLAQVDTIGIIPGSQGTHSYIVKGKGNPDSFESCSHGAGRKMGRKQAQRTLNLEEEKKRLDDLGIVHAIRGVQDLDEAPGSYKDIDIVMKNQQDLVDVLVELTPMGVIKG